MTLFKCIDQIDLEEKRVFIRADFNVPMKNGQILDDTKIRLALKTIQWAMLKKAKIILASHLGRPKGRNHSDLSLLPVAERLVELLDGKEMIMAPDCIGDGVRKAITDLLPGQILMLENVQFYQEELDNDINFATELARNIDVYVNDTFANLHRSEASTCALAELLPTRCAGFALINELEHLERMIRDPARPLVVVLGGNRLGDRLQLIDRLIEIADYILIGSGLATTFLSAQNRDKGISFGEIMTYEATLDIIRKCRSHDVTLKLPVDYLAAPSADDSGQAQVFRPEQIPANWGVFDIGPETLPEFSRIFNLAGTIFWNGAMGLCSVEKFAQGTTEVARAIGTTKALSLVSGGDAIAALKKLGLTGKIAHITGGGAILEFLENRRLPGLAALGYYSEPLTARNAERLAPL
jgi:phosphoglycerate kinase